MSKSIVVIQIAFLLWLLLFHLSDAAYAHASVVGHSFLSFLVMCTAVGLQVAHSHVVYVTPNATAPCPRNSDSSCHTLSWYSHNGSERLLSNDTVVILLKGTHTLNSTIYIENRKNLTIRGESEHTLLLAGDQPVSWINCTSSETGIVFLNSRDIQIMNLGFNSCGSSVTLDSDTGKSVKFNASAALLFGLSYNVSIILVIINNTYGYGLHMNCVFGNIWIKDSILVRASKTSDGKLGGNAEFWFGQCSNNCEHQCNKKYANLVILRSSFMQGLRGSIGIEIIIDCPQVYATMSNVNAVNNTGGNIVLNLTSFDVHTPSKIHIMNSNVAGGRASRGGGIHFWSGQNPERKHKNDRCDSDTYCIHTVLMVSNTNFSFNSAQKHGGAVYISHQSHVTRAVIRFTNCSFVNNFGNGAVMESIRHITFMDYPSPMLNVSLEGCHFHKNSMPNDTSTSGPIISLIMTYTTVSNCSFTDNNGSALTLLKSNLNFHGHVRFVNNHADYGAALKVCEASLISLSNNTHIWFINNIATFRGGAVYSYQPCRDTPQPCLFQPKLHKNAPIRKFEETMKLEFVNNSAGIAGDAIYGGSLDSCFTTTYNGEKDIVLPTYFDMTGQTGSSPISSDVMGVCFCDVNEPLLPYHCRTEHPTVEVYPGEMFNVSMITVGQMNGWTPGSIKAMLSDEDDLDRLRVQNDRNASSSKCENITLILQSKQKHATIRFEVATAAGNKKVSPSSSLILQVLLKPCPVGFILKEVDGGYSCDCDPILCAYYACPPILKCDIDRREISFSSSPQVWIGCLKRFSSMSCELAIGHSCHYCNSTGLKAVNVFHFDDQCLPGRTGVMCSACKPGHSHILESNGIYTGCEKCSNRNLLFLIPLFLLSGIALVVFLAVFNVTVTQGTLNGLMFYSTVAYSYPSVFYTGRNKFPWVFISLLNLDLGLEICAYNGMTGYHYMWLNCGYTFYLFCIQIFIVYLSKKFIFFTRLVGKNVVNVLATITLLIYTQILCICSNFLKHKPIAFSISNITSTENVLKFDANIIFLELKHIPLFIVAIVCILVFSFFTFSLLLVQCLQKQSSIWCLRWVEKLRPFYEAFTGPCHDSYRFWPGFLLLMRAALFLHIVQNSNKLGVAAVSFLIMSLGGIFPRGIYKKWKLTVLEFLFLLNLSVTFVVAEYSTVNKYKEYDHVKYVAAYLSVSFTSFLLVGILLYHIYDRIKGTFGWKMLTKLFSVCTKKIQVVKLRRSRNNKCDEERVPFLPQPLPPVIKFPDFHEPLLEN